MHQTQCLWGVPAHFHIEGIWYNEDITKAHTTDKTWEAYNVVFHCLSVQLSILTKPLRSRIDNSTIGMSYELIQIVIVPSDQQSWIIFIDQALL